MDASVLQLFSSEEILARLAQRRGTGCLHVFTSKESANIFLNEGMMVAAAKGLVEGEEVVKQILGWKEARYFWQPESSSTLPFKPLQIDIHDFLAKQKPAVEIGGMMLADPKPFRKAITSDTSSSVKMIPSRGSATGPVPLDSLANPASQPTAIKPIAVAAADLAATKNIDPTGHARSTLDEALLNKHKLTLVCLEKPEQQFKIVKVSSLIGRNPACDITISHPSISRQHCLLQITERGLHVKDLETTNGTTVNGIALKDGYINVGDKLTIGHLGFVLEKSLDV